MLGFAACGKYKGLAGADAIYGPIPGEGYVTLERFQAWQASEFAKNQAIADAQLSSFVTNVWPVLSNPTPAAPATTSIVNDVIKIVPSVPDVSKTVNDVVQKAVSTATGTVQNVIANAEPTSMVTKKYVSLGILGLLGLLVLNEMRD